MLRKTLLVATASAFLIAVGIPETSFAPTASFAAKSCGEGMRKNWRGKCVKAKSMKTAKAMKTKKVAKGSKKRTKRTKKAKRMTT